MKQIPLVLMLMLMFSGCSSFVGGNRALTPRENAASQLMSQGTQLLNAGKPDSAIRLYEQAIGLDPANGQCYYHMAQAWLAKGKYKEAKKYNSLARDYLENDLVWATRVARQANQIESLTNRTTNGK